MPMCSFPKTDVTAPTPRTVVIDTNVLINLIHVNYLDLLGALPGYEFVAPDEVINEITVRRQKTRLRKALSQGIIRKHSVQDIDALRVFVELRSVMDRGEAACLALASSKGWLLASDEKRVVCREARRRLGAGRLMTTPGLFVLAIRSRVMTVDEADAAKAVLERHRFRMKFKSFREIIGDGPQGGTS